MDPQIKKGILDTIVLAILRKADTYGYELSEQMAGLMDVSETALYPVLRRLEVQGFLETYSVEHSGRLRKYYHITALGLQQLNENAKELLELQRIISWVIEGVKNHDEKNG